MTAASGTKARMLEVARSQIGVKESPAGSNRVKFNRAYYGRDVSGSAYPWCAAFMWWCAQKAGIPKSVIPKTASTGMRSYGMEDWFRAKGRYGRKPKVGALVVFTFSHIGVVEKVLSGGRIQTIEGNTDSSGSRTGGRVMRKIRSSSIHGYCYPKYKASSSKSSSNAKTKPRTSAPTLTRVLKWRRPMMRGADVKRLQRKLGIRADGIFGPQTDGAVKTFQRRHKLHVDGDVGRNTARALGWTWKG